MGKSRGGGGGWTGGPLGFLRHSRKDTPRDAIGPRIQLILEGGVYGPT